MNPRQFGLNANAFKHYATEPNVQTPYSSWLPLCMKYALFSNILEQWFPTGEISSRGGNFGVPGGNSCHAGNINIAVNIARIIIHVCLIFLNNSWNHWNDKSKSRFFAAYVYLDKISSYSYEIDIKSRFIWQSETIRGLVKCHKCVCGRGSAPDPAVGAYDVFSDPHIQYP